jgi:hypothetical protein
LLRNVTLPLKGTSTASQPLAKPVPGKRFENDWAVDFYCVIAIKLNGTASHDKHHSINHPPTTTRGPGSKAIRIDIK